MRRLRFVLVAVLGGVVALAGAAGVFVATVDPNDYRGVIADRLQAIAGQPVMLRGPLHWTLGLVPTVSAEDVMVGAPDGASGQSMRVGAVEIQVELIPFVLERAVRVRQLVVRDAAVVLDLPAAEAGSAPPSALPMLPEIAELEIRGATVTVRDAARAQTWQMAIERALFRADSDQLTVSAAGRFNEQAFTVEGRTGRFATLTGPAPFPVAFAITVGALARASVDGTVVNALTAPSPDLTVTFEGAELQRAAALAGVTVPPLGALRGEMKLRARDGQLTVPQLHLEFGAAERLRVTVDGSVREPLAQRGVELSVVAEGREIGAFSEAAIAGQRLPFLPALGPFAVRLRIAGDHPSFEDMRVQVGRENGPRALVTGRIDRPLAARGLAVEVQANGPDGVALARLLRLDVPLRGAVAFQARVSDVDATRLRFQNLRATVGPNDLTGDVTVATAGPRPAIAGELVAARIDVASLSAEGRRASGGADGRVFSEAPLPFDLLGLADAELRVRAARIDGLPVAVRNATATIVLRAGDLSVRPWAADLGGGRMSGDFTANSRGAIALRTEGRGLNLGATLREMQLSDKLDGGRADINLDLRGAGRSLRAIMATANGSETLIVRGGTVDNRFFELIGADLMRWLGNMVRGAERPTLNCAVHRFDIRDGLATARVMMFDTSQMTAAGEGTINLATEALAMRLQPRPRDASLLSIAVPLEVGGTLARPSFRPDTVGAIGRTAGAIGTTAVLGPIGAVLSLSNLGSAREDPCASAVALAQGQAPPRGAAPAAQPSTPSRNPIEGIGDGIGRGLRGIFGR